MTITRQDCIALDRDDPLGDCRDRFQIPDGLIYLDGNSLGALPAHAPERLGAVVREEWGKGLIQSWNKVGWFALPRTLGDRIGALVGASQGQIVVCDNTSINLYKALQAALAINPDRSTIIADRGDFPTDLYMIEGAAASAGRPVAVSYFEPETDPVAAFTDDAAVAVLSEVNYRTGERLDMAAVTAAAHQRGILVIWDLCHSAGAMPIALDACNADFAIGCCYKFLNGGPGAPAFVYAATRHHGQLRQPLQGWWSHQAPFDFNPEYQSAGDIRTMLTGTQPVLSMQGVGAGLDTFDAVDLGDVRSKSGKLCQLFIDLVDEKLDGHNISLCGPTDVKQRGSHVAFHYAHGFPVVQAMIEAGVIGDFRAPDLMRFGFAPLYIGFEQVYEAVDIMVDCIQREVWNDPRYQRTGAVT